MFSIILFIFNKLIKIKTILNKLFNLNTALAGTIYDFLNSYRALNLSSVASINY